MRPVSGRSSRRSISTGSPRQVFFRLFLCLRLAQVDDTHVWFRLLGSFPLQVFAALAFAASLALAASFASDFLVLLHRRRSFVPAASVDLRLPSCPSFGLVGLCAGNGRSRTRHRRSILAGFVLVDRSLAIRRLGRISLAVRRPNRGDTTRHAAGRRFTRSWRCTRALGDARGAGGGINEPC